MNRGEGGGRLMEGVRVEEDKRVNGSISLIKERHDVPNFCEG